MGSNAGPELPGVAAARGGRSAGLAFESARRIAEVDNAKTGCGRTELAARKVALVRASDVRKSMTVRSAAQSMKQRECACSADLRRSKYPREQRYFVILGARARKFRILTWPHVNISLKSRARYRRTYRTTDYLLKPGMSLLLPADDEDVVFDPVLIGGRANPVPDPARLFGFSGESTPDCFAEALPNEL